MTPEETRREEIRIASLMQEKIREAMGEWKCGDKGHIAYNLMFIAPYLSNPWKPNHGYFLNTDTNETEILDLSLCIRLPLPIDPVNPERGLWGMVDWDLFSSHTPNAGEWYIFGMSDRRTKGFSSEWCSPYLALLLALAHQWGIGVTK